MEKVGLYNDLLFIFDSVIGKRVLMYSEIWGKYCKSTKFGVLLRLESSWQSFHDMT